VYPLERLGAGREDDGGGAVAGGVSVAREPPVSKKS